MRRSTYAKIGKEGTELEFRTAFNKVGGNNFMMSSDDKRSLLIEGAAKAFHEGRAENIQIAFEGFYSLTGKDRNAYVVMRALQTLTSGRENKAEIIARALEKVPEGGRKALLSEVFLVAVDYRGYYGNTISEDFYGALLKCGADFDTAIAFAHKPPYDASRLAESLITYKNILKKKDAAEKSAPAQADVLPDVVAVLSNMQQQIEALAKEVSELRGSKAEPRRPPNKNYPKL
jgi:hypothetical protein